MRRFFSVSSFIDTHFLCGIIPSANKATWPRSSTAEQLPLKQLVLGSNPNGVTKKTACIIKLFFCFSVINHNQLITFAIVKTLSFDS